LWSLYENLFIFTRKSLLSDSLKRIISLALSPPRSCSPLWVPYCSRQAFSRKQWILLKIQEAPEKGFLTLSISLDNNRKKAMDLVPIELLARIA